MKLIERMNLYTAIILFVWLTAEGAITYLKYDGLYVFRSPFYFWWWATIMIALIGVNFFWWFFIARRRND
ncbi:MAG: hypothetical protein WC294_06035 [Methanoregula sp.]|jgi:hypothetical protein